MSYDIGSVIKKIVKDKGHNVEWLANQLGISKQSLYKTLNKDSFNTNTLISIANALNVDVTEFFRGLNETRIVNNKKFEPVGPVKDYDLYVYYEEKSKIFENAIMSILAKSKSISKEDILETLGQALQDQTKISFTTSSDMYWDFREKEVANTLEYYKSKNITTLEQALKHIDSIKDLSEESKMRLELGAYDAFKPNH